jgi:DNA polymerase I-like protein with 3'-5' exonuclease and polymerase domains
VKLYGLDIETLDPLLQDRGPSWVYGEGGVIVTGLYNAGTGTKKALAGNGGATIKKLLLDPNATLVGANIGYDLGWLCHEHGLLAKDAKCSLIDVSMAEECVDEYQQYSLDALAWKYLGERKGSGELPALAARMGLKGDFRKHLKALWDAGYEKEIKEYVLSDADQPVRIWEKQKKILEETGALDAAIINFKLIKIVLGMKQRGVKIDMAKRKKNYALLKGVRDELQAEFEKKHGKVNFNSSKQLAALFDREGVPYRRKIRIKGLSGGPEFAGSELWEERKKLKPALNGVRVQKGQLVVYEPSQYAARTVSQLERMGYLVTCNANIDKKALKSAKKSHEVARDIVDLKQAESVIDKFLGPKFDRFIVNGRIHADFNIVGARQTGRFSSSHPNLQQVPSKTTLFEKTDREIKLHTLCREIIVPDDGYLLGKIDYSGQENRIMAHFAVGSGAEEIRKQYNEDPDLDFHAYIGNISGLYDEYGEEIGRKYAKNCSFGLGYGMQIQTMTETFDWTREQAERITALYHEGAPFVKATMDKVSEVIVKRCYIKTLGGRRRHLQSFNGRIDARGAYKGFNKLVQGSAADMTKSSIVELDERGLLEVFPLLLQVHDEIDFHIPKTVAAIRRLPELQKAMEEAVTMQVPIRADLETGNDWGHLKKRRKSKTTGKLEPMDRFVDRIIKEAKAK